MAMLRYQVKSWAVSGTLAQIFNFWTFTGFVMLLWLAIITYFISGLAAFSALVKQRPIVPWLLYGPALIGLAAHSAQLISEVMVAGMLQMSLLNTISICVWMTIAVILISSLSKPLHNLFVFLMPVGAAFLVLALFAPHLASPRAYTTGMLVHIFISLLAYSVMIIATLQAILVNIQSNDLQQHRLNNRISRILPPLQSMERLMFEWLMIGFVLLTASIITGGIYVDDMLAQHLIHKTVLTLIAWGFFAILIFGHFYLGWRGRRASKLIYVGFGFLLVAFIGSKFVLEYLLHTF
jgi:ABC-type uncharacterized transport system permease subunit